MPSCPTRCVAIVDDHPLWRQALVTVLTTHQWSVVSQAPSAASGRSLLDTQPALDLLIVDVELPDGSGLDLLTHPYAPPAVTVSASVSGRHIHHALASGARGYVTKDTPADQLMAVIDQALAGRTGLSDSAQAALREYTAHARAPLTPRETSVVACIAEGHTTTRQVAKRLHITERTVKAHLTSVYQKTGIQDRTSLALAWRQGAI